MTVLKVVYLLAESGDEFLGIIEMMNGWLAESRTIYIGGSHDFSRRDQEEACEELQKIFSK